MNDVGAGCRWAMAAGGVGGGAERRVSSAGCTSADDGARRLLSVWRRQGRRPAGRADFARQQGADTVSGRGAEGDGRPDSFPAAPLYGRAAQGRSSGQLTEEQTTGSCTWHTADERGTNGGTANGADQQQKEHKKREKQKRQNPEAINPCRSAGSVAHADLLPFASLVIRCMMCCGRLCMVVHAHRGQFAEEKGRKKKKRQRQRRETSGEGRGSVDGNAGCVRTERAARARVSCDRRALAARCSLPLTAAVSVSVALHCSAVRIHTVFSVRSAPSLRAPVCLRLSAAGVLAAPLPSPPPPRLSMSAVMSTQSRAQVLAVYRTMLKVNRARSATADRASAQKFDRGEQWQQSGQNAALRND